MRDVGSRNWNAVGLVYLLWYFFRIFVNNMRVLGKLMDKAARKQHCRNLHHWRLWGSVEGLVVACSMGIMRFR